MSAKVIVFYCICWWICTVQGIIYKDNITDFTKCSTHISRSEGKYSKYYEINYEEKSQDDLLVFDFHFSVLGRSDAHILLAENDILFRSDPVYEIVIGAGSNTFSDLRRLQKSAGKVTARIRGLLSAIEIRSFWIHVWSDGLIEVGKETEELAFMAWKDPEPLNLRYFSFSTWPGVEAKWFFDCERKNTKGSELILTDTERLQSDLLRHYNIFTRPVLDESDIIDVELKLVPQYIALDVGTSKLSIKGNGQMKWVDEKLQWISGDYGGVELLKLNPHQLWTPDLRLHDYQVNLKKATVYKNGSVICNIHLDLSYWCNIEDLGSWPADVHNCSLAFRFMRDGEGMRLLDHSKPEDFFSLPPASEWTVTDLDIKYEEETNETINYDTEAPAKLTFFFILKRTSNIYRSIFFTPFLVISICSLCTFWVSPFGYLKITLCCIQLVMESVILICISVIIPGHSSTVPALVILYSDSLISTVFLVIISVIVINLARSEYKKYSMPDVIYYTLSSNILQNVLVLPAPKNDGVYGKLSENSTRLREESETSPWALLGTIIDRICFVIYSILFVVLISKAS